MPRRRFRWVLVLLVSVLLPARVAAQRPPVILVNGYHSSGCANAAKETSADTFGLLEQFLTAQGVKVYFFNNCSVPPASDPLRPTLEELGQALGRMIDQTGAAQVDLVVMSMGNLIARTYLSGKQNAPGVFTPRADPKVRKAVFIAGPHFGPDIPAGQRPWLRIPLLLSAIDIQGQEMLSGSRFLWDLNTWNQGTDDLRQVDAIAIAGNALDTGNGPNTSDSTIPLSSASISFATADERTRILFGCHTPSGCPGVAVSGIDSSAHPSWQIINSFLAGTDDWKKVGHSPSQDAVLSKSGGVFLAAKDASDNFLNVDLYPLSGAALYGGVLTYFREFVSTAPYTLQLGGSPPIPALSWTAPAGSYSVVTMKPGPVIARAIPAAGLVNTLSNAPGSFISIYGTSLAAQAGQAGPAFPTTLAGTTVTANGQALKMNYAGPAQVNAVLPDNPSGLVKLTVTTSQGSHSVNVLMEDAVPAVFSLDSSGTGAAAAIEALDGRIIGKDTSAQAGDYISLWVTGLGAMQTVNGLPSAVSKPDVYVDGLKAQVTYAGRSLYYPGVDQINFIVPAGLRAQPTAPLLVVSGKHSSNLTTLAIK